MAAKKKPTNTKEIRAVGLPSDLHANLKRAAAVVQYAHDSARSLLAIYDARNAERGKGAPSDEDQDLMRSALILAGAGLDSSLKHAIRDALPAVMTKSIDAQSALEKYAVRRFSNQEMPKILGRLMSRESARAELIELMAGDLTDHSLQSYEELATALDCLGIKENTLPKKEAKVTIDEFFRARNRIAHELDMDFTHATRNRRVHQRAGVLKMTNAALLLSESIVRAVDAVLNG